MSEAAVSYCPSDVDFFSLNDKIEEGSGKITGGGALTIDLEQIHNCNTATVCLLIELLRRARARGCRVENINMSPQLKKLLALYQLSDFFGGKTQ